MSKHFKMSEFSSPSVIGRKVSYSKREQVPQHYRANVVRLMVALEVIRAALGGKPTRVASGWRSQKFNSRSKGRATRSLHLFGKAADIQVRGVPVKRVYWMIKSLMDRRLIPIGGLAAYSKLNKKGQRIWTFVHYDIRGRAARWKKAPPKPRGM